MAAILHCRCAQSGASFPRYKAPKRGVYARVNLSTCSTGVVKVNIINSAQRLQALRMRGEKGGEGGSITYHIQFQTEYFSTGNSNREESDCREHC